MSYEIKRMMVYGALEDVKSALTKYRLCIELSDLYPVGESTDKKVFVDQIMNMVHERLE